LPRSGGEEVVENHELSVAPLGPENGDTRTELQRIRRAEGVHAQELLGGISYRCHRIDLGPASSQLVKPGLRDLHVGGIKQASRRRRHIAERISVRVKQKTICVVSVRSS
jgi:hypothetical protein